VVGLITAGADVSQIANATIRAADKAFTFVLNDEGFTEAVWLMTQLAIAAKKENLGEHLQSLGVNLPQDTSLPDLAAAVSEALDNKLESNGGRSDLGEMSHSETIQKSFEPYYRTTILSDETDPNKLHDLKSDLDGYQVYSQEQIDDLVGLYLNGADRDKLDPILDACVATYNADLDEDGQVDFKGKAKAFVRTYGFLSSILAYSNADWEKLSIFLNFLIPKLPAPKEEDLSRGILEAIDMDSYRVEVKTSLKIGLPDQDAEIGPVPTSGGGRKPEPELDQLSNIIKAFNDQFGNIDWKDGDKIRKVIAEEIPAKVAADAAYQNAMKNNDKKTARIEHDAALQRVMIDLLSDHTELFKQFSDNPSFKKWLGDTIFGVTYQSTTQVGAG